MKMQFGLHGQKHALLFTILTLASFASFAVKKNMDGNKRDT